LINRRINNPNLYYVSPLTYEFEETEVDPRTGAEGSLIGVYMPFPEEDLHKELRRRKKFRKPFSNKEITFLLYDLLNGLYHLNLMGVPHGTINPDFVARTTTGYAIIDDPLFDPTGVTQLDRFFKDNKLKGIYLSPEAFRAALGRKRNDRCIDIEKSDVFSFGVVILEAALLTKLDSIYETPNPQTGIDVDGLDHYISILQEVQVKWAKKKKNL